MSQDLDNQIADRLVDNNLLNGLIPLIAVASVEVAGIPLVVAVTTLT